MKLSSLLFFMFLCVALTAQPILTYENHALKAGVDNPMTYCNYSEVGNSGANINWDFTKIQAVKEFTGHISETETTDFSLANTELEEFGVKFYYNTSEDGILQYGYLSKDGRTRISYDSPFEKIHFPMSFRDSYIAPFSGEYFSNGVSIGQIEGQGQVEADAWGTILLPGNAKYENTIRIRTEKTYTLAFENSSQDVEIVTYRWYNSVHRYPLLVLIESRTVVDGNVSSTKIYGAYNSRAVKSAPSETSNALINQQLSVYPNPASDLLTLELTNMTNGIASISITDMSGREIVSSFEKEVIEGLNKIEVSDEISILTEGLYLLRLSINGQVLTHEISIAR